MIFISDSLIDQNKTLLGYIRPNGEQVTLFDVLTSKRAYSDFKEAISKVVPKLVIKNLGDEGDPYYIPELNLTDVPSNSVLMPSITEAEDIPTDKTWLYQSYSELIEKLNQTENLPMFHNMFEKYGQLDIPVTQVIKQNPIVQAKPMTTETDQIRFPVPTYSQLRSTYGYLFSKDLRDEDTDEFSDVNGNSEQKTSNFSVDSGNDLSVSSEFIPDYSAIFPYISKEYIPVNRIHPFYDSVMYQDCINIYPKQKIDPKLIGGSADNNTPELYPNEVEFYNSLKELYNECLAQENDVVSVENLVNKGVHSKLADEFLTDMIRAIVNLNWIHTGCATAEFESMNSDNESASDSIEAEIPGYYTISVDQFGEVTRVSLEDQLKSRLNSQNIVDLAAEVVNYCRMNAANSYSLVDAVIQLMRWGTRKPTAICAKSIVTNEKPLYFNLELRTVSEFSGSVSDLTPIKFDDGSEWEIYCIATTPIAAEVKSEAESQLNQKIGLVQVPHSVVTKQSFQETTSISSYSSYDILTFIQMLKTGVIKVHGVQYLAEDDKFSCSVEVPVLSSNEILEISSYSKYVEQPSLTLSKYFNVYMQRFSESRLKCNFVDILRELTQTEWSKLQVYKDELSTGTMDSAKEFLSRNNAIVTKDIIQDAVNKALAAEMVDVFYSAWQKVSDSELEDSNMILNIFYEVTKTQKPSIRQESTKPATRFEQELSKCTRFFEYSNINGPQFYLGYYTAQISPVEKTNVFCIWTAKSDTPAPKTHTPISRNDFLKNVYMPFKQVVDKVKQTGDKRLIQQFFDTKCFCNATDTWKQVIAIISEDSKS